MTEELIKVLNDQKQLNIKNESCDNMAVKIIKKNLNVLKRDRSNCNLYNYSIDRNNKYNDKLFITNKFQNEKSLKNSKSIKKFKILQSF